MTLNARTPTLDEIVRVALDRRLADVHVSLPGVVVSYDAATQSATVRPMLQALQVDPAGTGGSVAAALPDLLRVPVVLSGGGGFRVTFPVKAGDPCWLVFSDRSLDRWKSTSLGNTPLDPQAETQHALADAWAVVGGRPLASPWASAPMDRMTMGADAGAQVEVLQSRINLGVGASQAVVLGTQFQSHMQSLQTALTSLSAAITPLMMPPAVGAAKAALQQAISATSSLAGDISSNVFTT